MKIDTKRKPFVFIPNIGSGHDFSAAEEFGTLIPVTEGWVNPLQTGVVKRRWEKLLESSSPEDFIVVTSLPIIFGLGAVLFAQKHSRLNLLIFTSKKRYIARTIILE